MIAQDWIQRNPILEPKDSTTYTFEIPVNRFEFDALKEEVEALKKLLKAAKIYDEETGQSDCEIEEKMELIRKFAEALDIDLSYEN